MMNTSKGFTKEEIEELKKRPIDYSDIPEITDEEAKEFYFRNYRPIKKQVSVRLDADILEWLKKPNDKGYQSRLNTALRWAMNKGYSFS